MGLDKDKKIEIQQRELVRLDNENSELRQEVSALKSQITVIKDQLEIEKNKPKEGYERTQKMMEILEKKQSEYIALIESLNKLKEKYNVQIL